MRPTSRILLLGSAVAASAVAACTPLPPQSIVTKCEASHSDGSIAYEVKIPPEYPAHPPNADVDGHVLMRFDLTQFGTPHNIEIIESEPEGFFDAAAMAALQQWKYCPDPAPRTGLEVQLSFEME